MNAARLYKMVGELTTLRNAACPEGSRNWRTNPTYHRYNLAISALRWLAKREDGE